MHGMNWPSFFLLSALLLHSYDDGDGDDDDDEDDDDDDDGGDDDDGDDDDDDVDDDDDADDVVDAAQKAYWLQRIPAPESVARAGQAPSCPSSAPQPALDQSPPAAVWPVQIPAG